ncbi:MAG TPA: response regulator [Longimicrobium sp.]|uniref:response regulator n=1 Tax=Longimicrobium sp. TaxID=2029185 RepID=UPI002ED7743C
MTREPTTLVERTMTDPRPGATILVVDDDDGVRRVTRRILERRGYRVVEAASGPEALDVASEFEGPIDLVIMDIMMPGMTGNQTSYHLAEIRPGTPLLCVSGRPDAAEVRLGVASRAAFLPKPFTPDELADAVQTVLLGGAA